MQPFLAGGLAALSPLLSPALGQELVFEPPRRTETLVSPDRLLVADVGGSSSLDVVVHAQSGPPAVQLGLGDGTFGPPLSIGGAPDARVHAVGDLDEDGRADLVTVSPIAVALRFGDGDGTFGPEVALPAGVGPVQARLGDFDGDAHLDVLVVRQGNLLPDPGDFAVHFGDGAGGFSAPVVFQSVGVGGFPTVGDLNGDLVDDVVALRMDFGTNRSVVDVWLGSATRGFTRLPTCSSCTVTQSSLVQDLVLGDLDGDGDLDLGFSESDAAGITRPAFLRVGLNDGTGAFAPGDTANVPGGFTALVTGDVDRDGDDDLVAVSTRSFSGPPAGQAVPSGEAKVVRMEAGFVGPGEPRLVTAPDVRDVAVGDVDGDGRLDAVGVAGVAGAPGTIDVLHNATYRRGEPFVDLGRALPGSHGFAVQLARRGAPGEREFRFTLANAVPGEPAWLVLGPDTVERPFLGGVLVPRPFRVLGPFVVDAAGSVVVRVPWPPLVSTERIATRPRLHTQFWFRDPGGLAGFAATTALETTPRFQSSIHRE